LPENFDATDFIDCKLCCDHRAVTVEFLTGTPVFDCFAQALQDF
jgi:hypothetical protein